MIKLITLNLLFFLSLVHSQGLLEHQTIFTSGTDNTHTFRIPAMVTAPNGDIIVAMDARRENSRDLNGARDIDIVVKRSSDNGKIWTPMEIVLNLPDGEPVSDPSMIVDDSTGHIFILYNYMDRDNADGEYRFYVQKSIDNGKTWSNFIDFTDQIAKPEWKMNFKFITSGRGIQTRNGTLLHCMVNLSNGMHIFGSDDHGVTWFLKDIAITPANESKIIELDNGTLMINSRHNGGGTRYVHRSTNNGISWNGEVDQTLIDPGCNGSILRYTSTKDGYDKSRLIFSNANHASRRINMTVRISYDEGQTWSSGKVIEPAGAAYSDLTILKDGTIGLVYETAGYASIKFARFTLDWLTDGQDSYTPAILDVNDNLSSSNNFNLFKNPFSDIVHFIPSKNWMHDHLMVYNNEGKIMLTKPMSKNVSSFSIRGWPQSIYYVSLFNKKSRFIKKFIVTNGSNFVN